MAQFRVEISGQLKVLEHLEGLDALIEMASALEDPVSPATAGDAGPQMTMSLDAPLTLESEMGPTHE